VLAVQVHRILVAIDYSVHARRAFAYAVELARKFEAKLELLHVWERPAYLPEGLVVGPPGQTQRTVAELIRENAEREMAEFLHECRICEGLEMEVVLETGEPAAAILRVVREYQCDLIVMGAQGHTGVLHHLILGSVTDKVVRLSTVPVITVPDPRSRRVASRRGSMPQRDGSPPTARGDAAKAS
jgi:universal stress protein A